MRNQLILFFLLFARVVFAQTDSIEYSHEYEFKEGIYLTYLDFKENNPIPSSAIISSIPKNQIDFMTQVMEQKYVTFKNNQGSDRKVKPDSVWGYSQNNAVYINFNHEFNRVSVLGSLFHFLATIEVLPSYRDPMDNYALRTNEEVKQFLFDMQTNKVLDFNVKNMEMILSRDPILHEEFKQLSNRKKGDSIFIYLRKYNTKHPLYLSAIK